MEQISVYKNGLSYRSNDMTTHKDRQPPEERNCITSPIQEDSPSSIKLKEPPQFTERACLTPAEFSKLWGKSKIWGYRRIYDGTVKVVSIGGRLMIPITEINKLVSTAKYYNGELSRVMRLRRAFTS